MPTGTLLRGNFFQSPMMIITDPSIDLYLLILCKRGCQKIEKPKMFCHKCKKCLCLGHVVTCCNTHFKVRAECFTRRFFHSFARRILIFVYFLRQRYHITKKAILIHHYLMLLF